MNRGCSRFLYTLFLCGAVLVTPLCRADGVPPAYRMIGARYDVPPDILYAVALQESGFTYQGRFGAWPWTLNIEGQSYRFASRRAAYEKMADAVAAGRSVDGCIMQINWRWHKHRFENLWTLFDPYACVSNGAEFLAELYARANDWWTAVGHYHAPGGDKKSRQRAEQYRQQVRRRWQRYVADGGY